MSSDVLDFLVQHLDRIGVVETIGDYIPDYTKVLVGRSD